MKRDAMLTFGKHIRHLRQERELGIRALATKANIDAGGLTRLEQGKTRPRPDTLKALASALKVPLADLFAMAGYVTPADLPSMSVHLRMHYGELSEQTLTAIDKYIRHLVDEQGLDPNGPAPLEDETGKPSKE